MTIIKRQLKTKIIGLGISLVLPMSSLAAPASQSLPSDPTTQSGQVIYNGRVINVNQAAAPPALPDYAPAAVEAPAPRHIQAPRDPREDPHQRGLSLGGPRFGVSYINGGGFDKLQEAVKKAKPNTEVEPAMSQFGWQVEYRMFRTDEGLTALTELIPLVGGMDQGLALPSATWLVGLRGSGGFEVGVGPNIGVDGVTMMLGIGYSADLGGINIPINAAVGRGAGQTTSVCISTGFNL